MVNSIDADGTQDGFDLELIELLRPAVAVPLVASGGAGRLEHFPPVVAAGADAVLAASIFHSGRFTVSQVKHELANAGVVVR